VSVPKQSSFAPAFWLLAEREREALGALHRFCRAADDAVDAAGDAEQAAERLARWQREVAALYGEGAPATPEGRSLCPHVGHYGLQRADFERMLAALASDVPGPSFATQADLERYCEGVASSPGYLALAIFGCPEARDYALRLGLALQLTNVLRDARADLCAGRTYFPREDLARAGLSAEALSAEARAAGSASPGVERLVALERARARAWFGEAERAYRAQPAPTRRRLATARAMERLYRELLARLEGREPLPRSRVRPGRLGAVSAVAGAWIEGLAILG
jgi:phytoene synthase